MQPKIPNINLLLALAVAAPLPQAEEVADSLQGTTTNGAADNGDFSTQALKNWQAAGRCKTDWDENNRGLNQCIGEANSLLPSSQNTKMHVGTVTVNARFDLFDL